MRTSKTIAGLIGPTLVAVAVAVVLNLGSFPALAEQVSRDPALIFLSGILLFVAGLAIVRAHNIWAGDWPKHRPDRCSDDRPFGAWRHPLVQGLQPRLSKYG
jgi:protein-S-isoprenylcysteine O-methyltransferase Ste14